MTPAISYRLLAYAGGEADGSALGDLLREAAEMIAAAADRDEAIRTAVTGLLGEVEALVEEGPGVRVLAERLDRLDGACTAVHAAFAGGAR